MFCLIYLHPVNRFPAVSHSTSPPADRCSLADISWWLGAIVCLMCATASIFPRASATMKYWSLIHSGENINGSANLKEKCQLGEGSSLSLMGHVKVNSLLGLKVQPQQHHQIKETHFNMTVTFYVWYLYFSSKTSFFFHPPSFWRPPLISQGHGIRKVTRRLQLPLTHSI